MRRPHHTADYGVRRRDHSGHSTVPTCAGGVDPYPCEVFESHPILLRQLRHQVSDRHCNLRPANSSLPPA